MLGRKKVLLCAYNLHNGYFNHVFVSCGGKMFNVNTSEIVAECFKMFGVCDVAEAVATRKDRFIKRYVLSSSVVCEICSISS